MAGVDEGQAVAAPRNRTRRRVVVATIAALVLGVAAVVGHAAWRARQERQLIESLRDNVRRTGETLVTLDGLLHGPGKDARKVRSWLEERRVDAARIIGVGADDLLAKRRGDEALAIMRRHLATYGDDVRALGALSGLLDDLALRDDGIRPAALALKEDVLRALMQQVPPPPAADEDRALNPRMPVPAGSFRLGAVNCPSAGRPGRPVMVSAFTIQAHEVTNEEYRRFVADHGAGVDPRLPVVDVDWHEATAYCAWLGARLPTVAEWEYAARAGSETEPWCEGSEDELARVAWYRANSGGHLHPVATKEPNAWGLYDVLGNALEWCQDWRGDEAQPRAADPVGAPTGWARLTVGGQRATAARFTRVTYHFGEMPYIPRPYISFRCRWP